ncbi:hypothetical protein AAVH_14515 [Aphelenchoides avenae]|nr:hypothetical protein AAVH_14515 [Aphelenchus avenae]
MLLRRVLCTTVVLVSLTLLHWPQFAHGVLIVEVDSLGIDGSVATYKNNRKRELTIDKNDAFNLTLATSDQVLSLDMNFGNNVDSKIEIVSAESLHAFEEARCKWSMTTKKTSKWCTMTFTVTRGGAASNGNFQSTNCKESDVYAVVDVTPGNIKAGNLQLVPGTTNDVPKGLKKCTEIQQTRYNQSIYNSTRPNPSNVTYVWKIALKKTTLEQVVLRLRDMTPVQFVPDPTTTAGPNTTTAPTTNPANAAASSNSPTTDTTGGISAGAVGGIAGGVAVLLLVTIVVVVVIVYICRRRGRQSKTIPVEDQPPPEAQAVAENAPNDAKSEDDIECSKRTLKKHKKEPIVHRAPRNQSQRISIHGPSIDSTTQDAAANPTDLKNIEKAAKAEPSAMNDKA